MKHCRYYNIHFIMHMGSGISYILCEFIWDKGMPALSEELVLFNACIGWLQRWIESCSMQTLGDWRVAHYWKTKESPNAGNAWLMSRSMQVLEKLKRCSMQAFKKFKRHSMQALEKLFKSLNAGIWRLKRCSMQALEKL